MTEMQQLTLQNQQMIYDPNLFSKIEPRMFTHDFWEKQEKVTGISRGRGITVFFQYQEHELVLRHYLRGGLIGRFIKDKYINLGLEKSRAYLELKLLQELVSLDLPVPKPAALLFENMGVFYKADIIIHKIPGARDAHHTLIERKVTPDEWQRIGQTVATFHNHQVFHHDLNIHNIMLDELGKVWLIDFDKCAIKPGNNWKSGNVERLKRSLNKEQDREPQYHFEPDSWKQFMLGYETNLK